MDSIIKISNSRTNVDFFLNTILKMRLYCDIDDICKSKASLDQYKQLTIDVLNVTFDTGSNLSMKYISSVIEKWKDSLVNNTWKQELLSFCENHDDIIAAMTAIDEGNNIFVVVMEDSTSDNVIDYNIFGFDLIDKYRDDINDFMILDRNTANGIEDLLSDVVTIYQKR